jgi:hypothetical protein
MPLTYVFNPSGFDPATALQRDLKKYGDCARYFLHTIIMRGQVSGRADADEFVMIKAELMRYYFPGNDHYKKVRDRLVSGGSIECDGNYVKGQKAFGYRLGKVLRGMRHQRVEITNRTLKEKIQARCPQWIEAPEPVHQHLQKNLSELEIDYSAALDDLLHDDQFSPSDETAIQMIRDREFFFYVCDYGRVHTNLTNLKSSMRRFLTHRERPLVNLDIRNSQPLFFGVLLMDEYRSKPLPDDVRLYLELVQAGRFYDHLMSAGGIPAEGRQAFKRSFFGRVFFCENEPVHESARLFGNEFPNVYAAIRAMKAEDYRALAHRLQRAESDFMIGKVSARIMNEYRESFIATLHDSVVTTSDHGEAMKAIMLEEFRKIGLSPAINAELLKP